MMEIFVPNDVSGLHDLVGWMIMTLPDFTSVTVPNGNPDMAFAALNKGLTEVCKDDQKTFCEQGFELAKLAKTELKTGNEEGCYEALNKIWMLLDSTTGASSKY